MINFSNFASTEALLIMCNLKTENVSGVASLQDEMSRRVLLLDGSTGVELLRLIPCAVNPDMLSVTHPELVARMHGRGLKPERILLRQTHSIPTGFRNRDTAITEISFSSILSPHGLQESRRIGS